MIDNKSKRKGIILFVVLGTILLIIVMANVMLMVISSHGRLTYHQVNRVQAYYAAQAGMNLAIERLRIGDPDWIPPAGGTVTRLICMPSGCPGFVAGVDVADGNFPIAIKKIEITICNVNPAGNPSGVPYRISAKAYYTPS
jgi:hypothetical protein